MPMKVKRFYENDVNLYKYKPDNTPRNVNGLEYKILNICKKIEKKGYEKEHNFYCLENEAGHLVGLMRARITTEEGKITHLIFSEKVEDKHAAFELLVDPLLNWSNLKPGALHFANAPFANILRSVLGKLTTPITAEVAASDAHIELFLKAGFLLTAGFKFASTQQQGIIMSYKPKHKVSSIHVWSGGAARMSERLRGLITQDAKARGEQVKFDNALQTKYLSPHYAVYPNERGQWPKIPEPGAILINRQSSYTVAWRQFVLAEPGLTVADSASSDEDEFHDCFATPDQSSEGARKSTLKQAV